jgi:hypothetical protein
MTLEALWQIRGAVPATPIELITGATTLTKAVLVKASPGYDEVPGAKLISSSQISRKLDELQIAWSMKKSDDVAWDVVLVDGPHGYAEGSPGRMAAIYSAAVMARTRGTETDVLVHDFQREVESVCAKEFLCEENRVEGTSTPSLGHYVVRGGGAASREDFCSAPATKKTN